MADREVVQIPPVSLLLGGSASLLSVKISVEPNPLDRFVFCVHMGQPCRMSCPSPCHRSIRLHSLFWRESDRRQRRWVQLGRAVAVSQLNGGCESAACQLVLLQPSDFQLHHSDVVL